MTGGPAARSVPGRGRLCSVRGTAWSGTKPASASSSMSCSRVRKHCGSPENSVKTKRSPATGSSPSGKVDRENVNTKSPAPGLATRAASRMAARNCAVDRARFQMPCPITRSTDCEAIGSRSIGAITRLTRCPGHSARARRAAAPQHWCRQIQSDDSPAEVGERNRVAASPAPEIERATGTAFAFLGREPQ